MLQSKPLFSFIRSSDVSSLEKIDETGRWRFMGSDGFDG